MKKCINCGKEVNNNNENFCHYCGEKLVEVQSANCKRCGVSISPDSDFCENCVAELNSFNSSPSDMYMDDLHTRDSIYVRRNGSDKVLIIAITAAIVACITVITVVGAALILKNKDDKVSKTEDPTVVSETNPTGGDSSDKPIGSEKSSTEAVTEFEESAKESGVNGGYENKDERHNSAQILYDYDSNNDDWYRLRKSKWDPSTQIGAYKTVEKALSYAEIYCPQGYVLYNKDFDCLIQTAIFFCLFTEKS